MALKRSSLLSSVLALALSSASFAEHALALHGEVKYPPDFKHFDYVNPNAPKGGTFRISALGQFDSFNPFINKGNSASGVGLIHDTLMADSRDEPYSQYGLIAQSVEIQEDGLGVSYQLNPKATFSDGKPITAEDVKFTFNTLRLKGLPHFGYYYGDVKEVKINGPHSVSFLFNRPNKELPFILGQVPVLAKHYWKDRDFNKPGLDIPVSSGPYTIASYEAGKNVVFKRNEQYWGKTLPVNLGRYNYDQLIVEYFLDDTVSLEAFKGGKYDFRQESNSKLWATSYPDDVLKKADISKHDVKHSQPAGMQGFVFNIRRELFQDRVLRKAMTSAFDFEWSNKNLFYGQYARTKSYFENSPLASSGLPSKEELALLQPFKDQLPAEVFSKAFSLPDTSKKPLRSYLREAKKELVAAGYSYKDGKLFTPKDKQVTLEILLVQPAFERVVLPFTKNLELLGIDATVRKVDQSQYVERLREFDFDMIVGSMRQSHSPGNEQRDFWSSDAANKRDSRNYIGIQEEYVDALVENIINAKSKQQLITACRALDRALLWNYYVIPQHHINSYRIALNNKVKRPQQSPAFGLDTMSWWIQE